VEKDNVKPGLSVSQAEEQKGKKLLQAVNGISFSLAKNESFALLGVNGAGKSTTFKMLSLSHPVSKGDIKLND
jgi:ABC-type multidrug transport system ATPase subunit